MCTNATRPAVRTPPEVVFGTTSTTGAAHDYRGGARITPPPMPSPGPHEQAISVSYLWRVLAAASDRRRAGGTMRVRPSTRLDCSDEMQMLRRYLLTLVLTGLLSAITSPEWRPRSAVGWLGVAPVAALTYFGAEWA